eukprot:TRINITY_DN1145_c0_g1_i3.p1 TRINITY_DN1145_c0_g1~~TRINITY_DN1145_c0_g1_i3.p1  ORF type:complete len:1069 (+),score=437.55 TRINITY_DN1145_c0_g1_i3:108-3314(+)
MDLATLVRNLLQPNNDVRKMAEDGFNEAKEQPEFLIPRLCGLVQEMSGGEKHMAALLLKKCLADHDLYTKLSPVTKTQLQAQLLTFLADISEKLVRRSIDSAVAALGSQLVEKNEWPELLPYLNEMSEKGNEAHMVSVLTIFSSMSISLEEHSRGVGIVIERSLKHASLVVKVAAVKAAITFILALEDTVNYRSLVPLILQAAEASLADEDSSTEVFEALIELVETDSEFVVKCGYLTNFLQAMFSVANNNSLDPKIRQFATEFMISFAEADSKAAKKQPQFIPNFVDLLIQWMLTETFEDPQEWANTTEELSDDEYTNADLGAEGLDRLALALGGSIMEKHAGHRLLSLITDEDKKKDWRSRFAAIKGISHVAEGCKEKFEPNLFNLTTLILGHFKDEHPKVRYTSGRAIAQFCTDFGPGFQANFSNQVLQAVSDLLKDPVPRIRHVAVSIIVNFCEEAIPETYADKLEGLLKEIYSMLGNEHEMLFVKESALSSISAIAENVGDKFIPYYDTFMPILKQVFSLPECKEHNTVKGKAIECASFVAMACGQEKFIGSGDSKMILDYMMGITQHMEADDTRGSYLMQSWVRMASCTKEHFQPYLDILVKKLIEQCQSTNDVKLLDDDEEVEKDMQCIKLAIKGTGEKKIGIKTSILEEKQLACEMLESYFETFGGFMLPYVEEISKAVFPLLQNVYSSGIRETSANLCPLIMKCLKANVEQGKIPKSHMADMMQYMIPQMVEAMSSEAEVDVAAVLMENFSESLTVCGDSCLQDKLLANILDVILAMFNESLTRRAEFQQEEKDEDDDDEKKKLEEMSTSEEEFLIQSSESVGALLKTHKAFIQPFIEKFLPQVTLMLDGSKFGPVGVKLALCILDDFMEHGAAAAMPFFTKILEAIWCCGLIDEEVAQAAAYGLTIAAHFAVAISTLPGNPFVTNQLTMDAFLDKSMELLKKICSKASDEDWSAAVANAVKALLTIVKLYPGRPNVNEVEIIPAICQILPVGGDLIEAKWVHEEIFKMVAEGNPLVVGQGNCNLPMVKKIAAELMQESEDDCRLTDQTKALIMEKILN